MIRWLSASEHISPGDTAGVMIRYNPASQTHDLYFNGYLKKKCASVGEAYTQAIMTEDEPAKSANEQLAAAHASLVQQAAALKTELGEARTEISNLQRALSTLRQDENRNEQVLKKIIDAIADEFPDFVI